MEYDAKHHLVAMEDLRRIRKTSNVLSLLLYNNAIPSTRTVASSEIENVRVRIIKHLEKKVRQTSLKAQNK